MREAPNRLIFPRLSHRINLLTRILSPCVAWRCLRVERAMEHTSRPQPLVIARVFASLAPTMYSNMYFYGRAGNIGQTRLVHAIDRRPRHVSRPFSSGRISKFRSEAQLLVALLFYG
jgi:hypothetical protein